MAEIYTLEGDSRVTLKENGKEVSIKLKRGEGGLIPIIISPETGSNQDFSDPTVYNGTWTLTKVGAVAPAASGVTVAKGVGQQVVLTKADTANLDIDTYILTVGLERNDVGDPTSNFTMERQLGTLTIMPSYL